MPTAAAVIDDHEAHRDPEVDPDDDLDPVRADDETVDPAPADDVTLARALAAAVTPDRTPADYSTNVPPAMAQIHFFQLYSIVTN